MSTAMSGAPSSAPAVPSTPTPASTASATPASTPASVSSGASTPNPSSGDSSGGGGDPGAKSAGQDTAGAAQQAKAAEIARKMKLKVNGREMELDEAEVVRRAQLAEGADQKFREAHDMRKQALDLVEAIKKNPAAVMAKLGLNVREFTEKYLSGELQNEMLTPEQRELKELREYREGQERTLAETTRTQQQQAQQVEFNKLQQRAAEEYDTQFTDVLSKSNLPKTPETVKRVASLLLGAQQKGYDLDIQTAVDMVRQGYMTDVQSLFGGLKGEQVIKMLGEATVKEIRQWDMARIKAKLAPPAQAGQVQQAAAPQQRAERSQQMGPAEWLESIRKKAGVES